MQTDYFYDEILSIEEVGIKETIDIAVSGDNLFYANDILTHNSGYSEIDPGMNNIAGGMTQVHTCDLLINITNTAASRERGEITLTMLKTRNSGGVGKSVVLAYDVDTLRMYNLNSSGNTNSYQQLSSKTNNVIIDVKSETVEDDTPIFDRSNSGKKISVEKHSVNNGLPPALTRLLGKAKTTI
jgi:hypothetical protein